MMPDDPITAYADDVMAGRVIAGRLVRLACERHQRDLDAGVFTWKPERAHRVINFFERFLRLAEGEHAGKPFILEPFQKFIVGSMFGWYGPDGYRRFRLGYVELAKGNGKSPMCAGIGLYGLVADGEPGAEIYAAAVTRDQANILFGDAEKMVRASETLHKKITQTVNNLAVLPTNSFFRPVSSEARGLDGHRVAMALIDEIHEHPSPIVVDKMRAGTKGRRQALVMEITNAGYDRTSVCWAHHVYSTQVLEGAVQNDSWFAYIASLDPCPTCQKAGREFPRDDCPQCDDWKNPDVWIKANPCLGVSVTHKYLEEQVREAVGMPTKENLVKRLNFCQWTQQDVRWLPMSEWDQCVIRDSTKAVHFPTDEELAGRACYAGLDLASINDLTAFVLIFPPADGERLIVKPYFWLPELVVESRFEKNGVPYPTWVRQGFIRTTPGNIADYDVIRGEIKALGDKFQILEIGYDAWNATQIVTQLTGDGFVMFPVRQGFASLTAPSKELEKRVLSHNLDHGGNPVLRWMASNVAASTDAAGNVKPDKQRSYEKIDGIVGLILALSRLIVHEESTGSIYDQRGIDTL